MTEKPNYISVSDLTYYLKNKFDTDANLNQRVYLTGEVSNYRKRPKHQYFSLKDDQTTISAVCFASKFERLKFDLEEGMKVQAYGKVSLYPRNGQYQIYIDHMEPAGVGQLYQAYQQNKAKLEAEGLFDEAHKQAIPKYADKIAVITSPSGAVIRDIIKTTNLRDPRVQIVLYPAAVQGPKAVPELKRQLQRAIDSHQYDTIIIGRGGGSIEDLWAFNDEALARMVYNCPVPIISSVGHQTDFTLTDYVADRRAATPTAAAEFAVDDRKQIVANIYQLRDTAINYIHNQINKQQQQVQHLVNDSAFKQPLRQLKQQQKDVNKLTEQLKQTQLNNLANQTHQINQLTLELKNYNPINHVRNQRTQVNDLQARLQQAIKLNLNNQAHQFDNLASSLKELNPTKILNRGFAYVTKDQHVVNNINQIKPNDILTLHLANGTIETTVNKLLGN